MIILKLPISRKRPHLRSLSCILDLLLKILFPCAEEDFFHYGGAEGYEGVEVMKSSEHGVVRGDGEDEDEHSEGKSPDAEEIDEGEG